MLQRQLRLASKLQPSLAAAAGGLIPLLAEGPPSSRAYRNAPTRNGENLEGGDDAPHPSPNEDRRRWPPRYYRPPAPIDQPRTLADYNRLMMHLSKQRK